MTKHERFNARNAAGGIVQVNVRVPAEHAESVREYARHLLGGKSPAAARRAMEDPAQQGFDFGTDMPASSDATERSEGAARAAVCPSQSGPPCP